jgi:hypothetical protein
MACPKPAVNPEKPPEKGCGALSGQEFLHLKIKSDHYAVVTRGFQRRIL